VILFSVFFCGVILMKQSIDDLTNQAIDIVTKNSALQERVVEPLRKKIFPYLICVTLFNIVMFILILYMARRISKMQV
jgi:hypothetical protein